MSHLGQRTNSRSQSLIGLVLLALALTLWHLDSIKSLDPLCPSNGHFTGTVLDQEHQKFRRIGTACVPVNYMNIVRAFIEGLSWCQCYLLSARCDYPIPYGKGHSGLSLTHCRGLGAPWRTS